MAYPPGHGGGPFFPQAQVQVPLPSGSPVFHRSGADIPRASFLARRKPTIQTIITDDSGPQPFANDQFDIFEWHGKFQSCVRYFLDHAQHTGPVQAVAAFLNIQLPFQKHQSITSSIRGGSPADQYSPHGMHAAAQGPAGRAGPGPASMLGGGGGQVPHHQLQQQQASSVTLTPYIRRLVATGFDIPGVLHGFFGDDWPAGVGPLHEAERRNYLFAAKSDNWVKVKASYDMDGEQMVPFLKPLQNVSEKEIVGAETSWSEWLAMQDWMLGPRAPIDVDAGGGGDRGRAEHGGQQLGGPSHGARIKREE